MHMQVGVTDFTIINILYLANILIFNSSYIISNLAIKGDNSNNKKVIVNRAENTQNIYLAHKAAKVVNRTAKRTANSQSSKSS